MKPADAHREAFVARLKLLLVSIGSVREYARRAGVSQTALRSYLSTSEPTRPMLMRLAEAAGARPDWLILGAQPVCERSSSLWHRAEAALSECARTGALPPEWALLATASQEQQPEEAGLPAVERAIQGALIVRLGDIASSLLRRRPSLPAETRTILEGAVATSYDLLKQLARERGQPHSQAAARTTLMHVLLRTEPELFRAIAEDDEAKTVA